MLERLPKAILIGIVVALIVLVVIFIISAILPGVELDASKWGAIVGLLAGLIYLITGENIAS